MWKYIVQLSLLLAIANPAFTQIPVMSVLRQLGIGIPANILRASQHGLLTETCGSVGCPLGQVTVPRPGHIPKFNGCGSYGFERLVIPELLPFTACCNEHDICYDTCGSNKMECDRQFQNCLFATCGLGREHGRFHSGNIRRPSPGIAGSCMSTAEIAGSLPVVAGCNSFVTAQMNACLCTDTDDDDYYNDFDITLLGNI